MPRVLIVDDDPGTCEGFEGVLRSEHFLVESAASAGETLTASSHHVFDLMLVDLRLPDMSGIDFIRLTRARGDQTPIVVVTGFGTSRAAVQAMRAGATDFVEKPLIGDEILDVVRSAITRARPTETPRTLEPLNYVQEHRSGSIEARLNAVLAAIEERYSDSRLSLALVAREIGISREYLCRLLRAHTGSTFGAHLQTMRLAAAQRLLIESTLSIKEVAAAVGYERTSQLDRHFRKYFELNPAAFRRLHESQ